MHDRVRFARLASRSALAAVLAIALAACAEAPAPGDASERLEPQASGSFSGGSLRRGSVVGIFDGVGLGNKPHQLEMTVEGVLWFECRNNGGKLAPGQFAFTVSVERPVYGDIDANGRFVEQEVSTDDIDDLVPTDDDCKRNWTLDTEGGVFLQVADDPADADAYAVTARLYEVQDDGSRIHRDTLRWTCDDPEPTHPINAYDAPELTGENGVCTLV